MRKLLVLFGSIMVQKKLWIATLRATLGLKTCEATCKTVLGIVN